MDRDTLRGFMQEMEKEARGALSTDGSFLEALQALKWQVDSDPTVRAATHSLRDRGMSVFTSFVPRIRIRLYAGEAAFARSKDDTGSRLPDAANLDRESELPSVPLTQELRDAASAAVAASPYCRHLDAIVNEAVKANGPCDRLAATIERAGYEVQISVEVSSYAQVREQGVTPAQPPNRRVSKSATNQSSPTNAGDASSLDLSGPDVQFLKDLRISLD